MEKSVILFLATVVSNQQLTHNIWELVLSPRDNFDVMEFLPGQFVCLEPLAQDSVMARPFSVAMTNNSHNTFTIMYKVVGANTKLMSQLQKDDQIKFWGPLGKGFLPNSLDYNEVFLIGGGIGIAPLVYYEKVVTTVQKGIARVFYGNRTKEEIIPITFSTHERVEIATDDGSEGFNGLVTNLAISFIKANRQQNILVITCGPNIMMQKIAEICQEYKIECYVLLERIMACGIGQCLGCSIKTKSGMKKICQDGPVFQAEEVIWHELN